MNGRLQVKLLGVRGSVPAPYPQNLGHGGNTPCIEIRLPGGEVLILDAGTGIRPLGLDLQRDASADRKVSIFLTHFHWDHIHGLPFFAPLFDGGRLSFYSGAPVKVLEDAVAGQMRYPYFPLDFNAVAGHCDFSEIAGDDFKSSGVTVHAFPVHHPQGAFGFRVEAGGSSLVYVPDREPGDPRLDSVIREHSAGADILIHDAQYTPEEYMRFKGWGHSTWDEATQVARDCKVKQLILFHHDPEHDDAMLSGIENQARAQFENTCAAREGWTASL